MKPCILSVSLEMQENLEIFLSISNQFMRILRLVYSFSAGYLFLMLRFTLTNSVKFQLLAFNNTYLNMALLHAALHFQIMPCSCFGQTPLALLRTSVCHLTC